jgi:hypothetical protein
MSLSGTSGIQYFGQSFTDVHIILADESDVFTPTMRTKLRELFNPEIEACHNFEELQLACDKTCNPIRLAISNINLPGLVGNERKA